MGAPVWQFLQLAETCGIVELLVLSADLGSLFHGYVTLTLLCLSFPTGSMEIGTVPVLRDVFWVSSQTTEQGPIPFISTEAVS